MKDRLFDHAACRARRLELGLSHAQLAERAGVSQSFIKYAESTIPAPGRDRLMQPRDLSVKALAEALETTPEALSYPKPAKPRAA